MKIKKLDLLNMIQEQNDVIAKLIRQVNCHHKDIIRIEGVVETEPQLKILDQSVFDGLDDDITYAVVKSNGEGIASNKRLNARLGCDFWAVDLNAKIVNLGQGYDASNWTDSLIEREKAELTEVDLSSELTGSDLCRAMLARGDKWVVCAMADTNESDAISNSRPRLVTHYANGFFEESKDMYWNHAVPINNQGEPLTQSEVGL